MNLYVLFALALGAFSGFSEASVAPRVFAEVVDVRAKRAGRCRIGSIRDVIVRVAPRRAVRPAVFSFLRIEAPLTGSASPRAPAI